MTIGLKLAALAEAECNYLAIIINEPFAYQHTPDIGLSAADFVEKSHSVIFTAIKAIHGRGDASGLESIENELHQAENSKHLAVDELINIASLSAAPDQMDALARSIKLESTMRQVALHIERGNLEQAMTLLENAQRLKAGDTGQEIQTFTAPELAAMELPEPNYVVDELITEGSAIIAGSPKIGKSWLVLGLCIAVAAGGRALGHLGTDAGDVLYLALEDNQRRLKHRMMTVLNGAAPPERLEFHTDWPRMGDGAITALEDWLSNHLTARLIVIDTLAKIRQRRPRNEDPYDWDHKTMSRITDLAAQHQIAILVVHHQRKLQAEDWIENLSGTTGLSGGADALYALVRDRGAVDAVLKRTGRDIDDAEIALRWNGELRIWESLGDADEHRLGQTQRAILEIFQHDPGQTYRPVAIYDILKSTQALKPMPKSGTIRWHLREMEINSYIKTIGDGLYIFNKDANTNQQYKQYKQDKHYQQDQLTVGSVGSFSNGNQQLNQQCFDDVDAENKG